MDGTPAKVEEEFLDVPVPLVLLDGVLDGLLRQAVLELEGRYGQSVDEEREIERVPATSRLGCKRNWRVTLNRLAAMGNRCSALALPGVGVP